MDNSCWCCVVIWNNQISIKPNGNRQTRPRMVSKSVGPDTVGSLQRQKTKKENS